MILLSERRDRDRRRSHGLTYLRWLFPGVGIKRWLLLFLGGLLLIATGALGLLSRAQMAALWGRSFLGISDLLGLDPYVAAAILLAGALMALSAAHHFWSAVAPAIAPRALNRPAERFLRGRELENGPRIVVLGGGTGLSMLLRGLKAYTGNITAIVAVSDDGGSSGRLRGELGILPPGDIRNCLLALADTEPLLEQLFQHRFEQGEGLKGHSFGNLFIAAMDEITGDFVEAVRQSSKVLAVRGEVLPATRENVVLSARLRDGRRIDGESRIPTASAPIQQVFLTPADPQPLPEALRAIREADAIILGPGSLYTSLIPHLLVAGIPAALRTARAPVFYVANLMTQPGESTGLSLADHLQAIAQHGGPNLVDYVMVHAGAIPDPILRRYAQQGAEPVATDPLRLPGLRVLKGDLLADPPDGTIRHDGGKLARLILRTVLENPATTPRQSLWHLVLKERIREGS